MSIGYEKWAAIRYEYVSDPGSSLRNLSIKHKVSRSAIEARAKREKWREMRAATEKRIDEKVDTIVDEVGKITDAKVNRFLSLMETADKLQKRIDRIIDKYQDTMSPTMIESLTKSLKNIKEICGSKSEIDEREQLARIRAIEAQLEKATVDKEIKVVIEGDLEEYSK